MRSQVTTDVAVVLNIILAFCNVEIAGVQKTRANILDSIVFNVRQLLMRLCTDLSKVSTDEQTQVYGA